MVRRPYNLYCVGADVKPCSINQSWKEWFLNYYLAKWIGRETVFDRLCVCVCAANQSVRQLGHQMLIASKRLKLRTSNFTHVFPGSVRTWKRACVQSHVIPKSLGGDMHCHERVLVVICRHPSYLLVFLISFGCVCGWMVMCSLISTPSTSQWWKSYSFCQ